jgi:hypothetical protein
MEKKNKRGREKRTIKEEREGKRKKGEVEK